MVQGLTWPWLLHDGGSVGRGATTNHALRNLVSKTTLLTVVDAYAINAVTIEV